MSLSSDLTSVAPIRDSGREPSDNDVNRDEGMNFASCPEKGCSEQQASSLADVNSSLLIPKDSFQNAPKKIQPSPRPLTRQYAGYYDPKTDQFSSTVPIKLDNPRPLTRQNAGYYDPKTGQFSSTVPIKLNKDDENTIH